MGRRGDKWNKLEKIQKVEKRIETRQWFKMFETFKIVMEK